MEHEVEQTRMEQSFEQTWRERGVEHILEQTRLNAKRDMMQTAVDHIRAIVEVCPGDQAQDRVAHWRAVAEAALEGFQARCVLGEL
jgi:Zn ribbon nucleic-acid-binding protein